MLMHCACPLSNSEVLHHHANSQGRADCYEVRRVEIIEVPGQCFHTCFHSCRNWNRRNGRQWSVLTQCCPCCWRQLAMIELRFALCLWSYPDLRKPNSSIGPPTPRTCSRDQRGRGCPAWREGYFSKPSHMQRAVNLLGPGRSGLGQGPMPTGVFEQIMQPSDRRSTVARTSSKRQLQPQSESTAIIERRLSPSTEHAYPSSSLDSQ